MGLDWCVENHPDGTTPYDRLGFKRLSKRDPQTVEAFRKIYDSHHEEVLKGQGHEGYQKFWSRPFEVVLDEEAARDPPPYIPGTGEDVPGFCTGGSFMLDSATSWRGKMIAFLGLHDDELVERSYGEVVDGKENMMSPEYAEQYADDLMQARADKAFTPEEGWTEQEVMDKLEEAELFLRFWADKGHPIYCWY